MTFEEKEIRTKVKQKLEFYHDRFLVSNSFDIKELAQMLWKNRNIKYVIDDSNKTLLDDYIQWAIEEFQLYRSNLDKKWEK